MGSLNRPLLLIPDDHSYSEAESQEQGCDISSALCIESNVIILFQSSDGGKARCGFAPETPGVVME